MSQESKAELLKVKRKERSVLGSAKEDEGGSMSQERKTKLLRVKQPPPAISTKVQQIRGTPLLST